MHWSWVRRWSWVRHWSWVRRWSWHCTCSERLTDPLYIRQPVHFTAHLCLSHVNRTLSCRAIAPKLHRCCANFDIFHTCRSSFLTCKPYEANWHFFSSCHALNMHPTAPVLLKGTSSIRVLHNVKISPGYSRRFGQQSMAKDTVSGPRPQTHAPSSNSNIDIYSYRS